MIRFILFVLLFTAVTGQTNVTNVDDDQVEDFQFSTGQTSNEICNLIKRKNVKNINIKWTILFTKRLFLISKHLLIYEIPVENYENSVHNIFLTNVKSVALENKWPKLSDHSQFFAFKKKIKFFSHVENDTIVVVLPAVFFMMYNIETENIQLIKHRKNQIQKSLLGSITSPDKLFLIYFDSNKDVYLSQRKIKKHNNLLLFDEIQDIFLFYNTSQHIPKDIYISKHNRRYYLNHHMTEGTLFQNILDWNNSAGFYFNKNMHIIQANRILIFSIDLDLKHYGENVDYKVSNLYTINAEDYFECNKIPTTTIVTQPTRKRTTHLTTTSHNTAYLKKKGTKLVIPIIVVILLLSFALFLVYYLKKQSPKSQIVNHDKKTPKRTKSATGSKSRIGSKTGNSSYKLNDSPKSRNSILKMSESKIKSKNSPKHPTNSKLGHNVASSSVQNQKIESLKISTASKVNSKNEAKKG